MASLGAALRGTSNVSEASDDRDGREADLYNDRKSDPIAQVEIRR